MIRIGMILYGFCGCVFGDFYEDKRIEAIGADWVVAREVESGTVLFYNGDPEKLEKYHSVEHKIEAQSW